MLEKETTNGINSMLAHENRTGDDNTFVRSMIGSYMFLGFGVVTEINDERMKVCCGDHSFANVELMILGVNGWGLKAVPDVGDRVLLLSTQIPVSDLKTFTAHGSMPPYDPSGVKAVPITDVSTAQLITVSKDGISVTGATQLTANSNGFSLTDAKGNTFVGNNDGITLNGNLLVKRS